MSKYIFSFSFYLFLNSPFIQGQNEKRTICDTIWILQGLEYSYNPIKKVKIHNNSDLRKLVDSLGNNDTLSFDKEEIAKRILEIDPIFKEHWSTVSVFPSLTPLNSNDSAYISLIQGGESFYYNYWQRFYYGYGPRWGRMHRGLDLGLNTGDSVRATFNGVVRYAKFNTGGYGNCVVIRHFNGIETLYAHLDKILVKPEQLVYASDIIGLGGTTGRSDGPHLHFETRFKGKSFDPLKIFNKDSLSLQSTHITIKKKDITDPHISSKTKKYHTVKSGETLSHIAQKNRTTVSKLQKLNGIKNPNMLKIGQKIRVR